VHLKNIFFFIAFVAIVFCSGCSSTHSRQEPHNVYLSDAVGFNPAPLIESLLDVKATHVQALTGEWKGNVFSASCVIKGDGETFTAIFSAPQMRLVTITLSRPHALTWKKAPHVPNALQPEYAITDIAFAMLETDKLKSALGEGFLVEDDGRRRCVSVNGNNLAILERLDDGEYKYTNPIRGYSYTIKDLK
jgi:hypothetical protein